MRIEDVHVALASGGPRADLVGLAVAADRLGYGALWLTELASRDAFGLLTEIALKTERIRLGTGIVNPFSRTPAVLAMSAATLAELSGRHVNLGLGASSRKVVEDLHGVPFQRPAGRIEETLEVVRLALSGRPIEYSKGAVQLRDFKLEVPGLEVRLWAAGFSPRLLEVAGRLADGWLPIHPSKRGIGRQLAAVRAAADRVGRPMPEVAAYIYTYVGTEPDEGLELNRRTVAWYIASGGEGYRNLFRRYGYEAEVARVTELWAAGRRNEARAVVDAAMLEDLSISARPEVVGERLEEFAAIGIDHPTLRFPDGIAAERQAAMLESVARALDR
ncbi:MAG: LLM class flavin-dependent oxidoreductase [Actinobacteria bacterium]|nr:LLM class flavin-dependent oxidoreductase [Actinomycetota bacterium]